MIILHHILIALTIPFCKIFLSLFTLFKGINCVYNYFIISIFNNDNVRATTTTNL